jgi:hypothetical protein|tara:strand:- start:15250 stop:17037 length:1788 start_codon:yes stop_codon:yes gene_type:complete
MSYLTKLAFSKGTEVIKVATNMEISIQNLIEKFRNECPPKEDLLQIVKQKNQIQEGLEQVVSAFDAVNTVAVTTGTLVDTISIAVQIIKAIPFPTSTPPGLGVPINVLTLLSDSLDKLGFLLRQTKGAVSVVPVITRQITDSASIIILKLQELDVLFSTCLEESLNNANMEWDPEFNYTEKDSCIYERKPYASKINNNLNLQPNLNPIAWQLTTMASIRENLAVEIGNVVATSGNFDDDLTNVEDEQALLAQLSANSKEAYIYKGFRFELQYEQYNQFSFPSRRIFIKFESDDTQEVYFGLSFYNLKNSVYSYSNSVKILVNEAKFRVDNLNYDYWWNRWNDRQLALLEGLTEEVEIIETEIGNETTSSLPPTNNTNTGTEDNSNPPNYPFAIKLIKQPWSNWNNLGSTDANFQRKMYGPNPYKTVPFSLDIGKSLQKSAYRANVNGLSDFGGMNASSSIRLKADVKVPGTVITFRVDTGRFTPNNISGAYPTTWGTFRPGIDNEYVRGKVDVKINAASGSEYQNIKLLTVQEGVKNYSFTYPEAGIYYIEATIWEGNKYNDVNGIPFNNYNFLNETAINANQSASLIISYENQP